MENSMDDLKQLEEKRNDIILKLRKIEDRKSHVSHEVYEKVKREYQEKLANLDQELTSHVELIKVELQRIEESQAKDSAQSRDLKLRMEEIELRYTIGEYDEETYQQQKNEVGEAISALENELQGMGKRKKWLQDIIDIKGIEKKLDEDRPAPERQASADISIDEHILEQTLPEETLKLDEIIAEEDAVRPGAEVDAATVTKTEGSAETETKQNTVACPKCGHQNAQDSWYCEKCGAEILDTPIQ